MGKRSRQIFHLVGCIRSARREACHVYRFRHHARRALLHRQAIIFALHAGGGAEYWLIASTQGEVNWNLEASYLAGKNASRRGTAKDNWHVQPDVYVPAFTMYGLPVPQSGKREVPAATPALGPNMIVGGSSLRSPPQYSPMSCFYIRSTFEEGYLFHTASGGQWVPDRIEAPLGCSRQQGSDKVEFSLWSDAAGQPGANWPPSRPPA